MSRFSRVFQLLTVVIVVAIMNVYVMGAPKASTDPKKSDAPAASESTTEVASAENVTPTRVKLAFASEKLKLAPGSKVDFNRLFSRTEIASRANATHNFLNAKSASRDLFKAPPRPGMPAPDDSDSGGGGSRGTWIALGVIAAVVTIAVIGLRHDRSSNAGSSAAVTP
jgi:hypothetical protein